MREESRNPSALDNLVGRATRLLGLEANHALHERDLVDDLLLALAPSHRISLLRLSSDAILRALAIGEVVLRHVTSLSNIAISPQGAYSILNNMGPAVRLLARGDETIELAGNADLKSAPFGDANMSLAAFIALRKLSESSGALDALEKAIKPGMTVPDRSALLAQLGSQLERAFLKPPKKKASKNNVASTA